MLFRVGVLGLPPLARKINWTQVVLTLQLNGPGAAMLPSRLTNWMIEVTWDPALMVSHLRRTTGAKLSNEIIAAQSEPGT